MEAEEVEVAEAEDPVVTSSGSCSGGAVGHQKVSDVGQRSIAASGYSQWLVNDRSCHNYLLFAF